MKNLGKTIDKLIQIDNDLEKSLKPIKTKWKRFPKREEYYWTELLTFLNSEKLMDHPEREKMKKVFFNPRKKKSPKYSFEAISEQDTIIGPLIGKLADKIRQLDLRSIRLAKEHVEANMTHDHDKLVTTFRKSQIIDVETRRVWIAIKDHFNLWSKPGNYNFKISRENNIIYLVEQLTPPQISDSGIIKMNPAMLRKFFGLGELV